MIELLVVVKGGGDLATGVTHRLFRAGMKIIITELEKPTVIRRTVSFAEAIFEGEFEVEGVTAKRASDVDGVFEIINELKIPIIVDPKTEIVRKVSPDVVVDATLAKKNIGTKITDAPLVIGLGPSFKAGLDVHAVVETKRGHNLGKVIFLGEAESNTGIPGDIAGYTLERVLRASCNGVFKSIKKIGDLVEKGEQVATVDNQPVASQISGVIRGLLHDDLTVTKGYKIGDVDPRKVREYCFTISDKARAIGGGVLEAILNLHKKRRLGPQMNRELK